MIQRVRDGIVRAFAGDGTAAIATARPTRPNSTSASAATAMPTCSATRRATCTSPRDRPADLPEDLAATQRRLDGLDGCRRRRARLKKGEAIPVRDMKFGAASRFAPTPDGTVYFANYPGIIRVKDGQGNMPADAKELTETLGERTAIADWHVGGSHITPDGTFVLDARRRPEPAGGLIRTQARRSDSPASAVPSSTSTARRCSSSGFHTVLVVYTPDASERSTPAAATRASRGGSATVA